MRMITPPGPRTAFSRSITPVRQSDEIAALAVQRRLAIRSAGEVAGDGSEGDGRNQL